MIKHAKQLLTVALTFSIFSLTALTAFGGATSSATSSTNSSSAISSGNSTKSSTSSTSSSTSSTTSSSASTTSAVPKPDPHFFTQVFSPYDMQMTFPKACVLQYNDYIYTTSTGSGKNTVNWTCTNSIYGYENTHWESLSDADFKQCVTDQFNWLNSEGNVTVGSVEPYMVKSLRMVKSTYIMDGVYTIDYETYWHDIGIAYIFTKSSDFTSTDLATINHSINSIIFLPREGSDGTKANSTVGTLNPKSIFTKYVKWTSQNDTPFIVVIVILSVLFLILLGISATLLFGFYKLRKRITIIPIEQTDTDKADTSPNK